MRLPFKPACLPLLLGSLPHRSAKQALEMSRRYAGALLAWPQLPQRGFREHVLVQSAAGFPGLVLDSVGARVYVNRGAAERELNQLALAYLEYDTNYGALVNGDSTGLDELLGQDDGMRGTLALKGQLLGPISLAAQLTDERQRPLIYDDRFFEALVQHLRLRASWQEARLRQGARPTIICLDEPFLEVVGLPFVPVDWDRALTQIDEVLAGLDGCKGLFASGAVDWSQVLRTAVDLIIADVYSYGHSLVVAAAALGPFLERQGCVGLGLIPADEEALAQATAEELVGRVAAFLDDLGQAGVAPDLLLRQAVISTNGPLGRLSVAAAERALQLIAEVSARLREVYALT